jgi:hypothetical protein
MQKDSDPADVISLDEKDRKAEFALLVKLEEFPSQGAKRDFCKEIGCPWDEYLRLKRKWRVPLERYRKGDL